MHFLRGDRVSVHFLDETSIISPHCLTKTNYTGEKVGFRIRKKLEKIIHVAEKIRWAQFTIDLGVFQMCDDGKAYLYNYSGFYFSVHYSINYMSY